MREKKCIFKTDTKMSKPSQSHGRYFDKNKVETETFLRCSHGFIATIRQLASSADILPSLEKGEMLDFCFGLATPRKGVLHLERVKRTLDRVAMLRSLCKA